MDPTEILATVAAVADLANSGIEAHRKAENMARVLAVLLKRHGGNAEVTDEETEELAAMSVFAERRDGVTYLSLVTNDEAQQRWEERTRARSH